MIDTRNSEPRQLLRFSGIAASRGIAIGPAYRYHRTLLYAEDRKLDVAEVGREIERFDAAVVKARQEIEKVRRVAEQKVGTPASAIFEAQMMMVSDEFILSKIRQRIKNELKPAAFVVDREFSEHQHMFETGENVLMRERVDDVEDIKQRLLRYLLDRKKWLSKIEVPSVLVADSLTPADAILFARSSVLGFAIDGGGVTSHVAILARSLGLPALVALHSAAERIETGDLLILDGERGELIVNPDLETLRGYEQEQSFVLGTGAELETPNFEPDFAGARTADGHAVRVLMNLEFGSEIAISEAERLSKSAASAGSQAIGLGLVRTEHFLLLHDDFPTEEEQTILYRDLVERFHPAYITLRTFDVGGDKVLSGSYREDNPFLGWRGLRISLDEPELFLAQLRAILRASARGNVRVMFPMVTTSEELVRALEFLEQARHDLRIKEEPFDEKMPIGIMIEVPSAAIMAESFLPMVDYLSIGSNDLTQYTLAVDRGNDLIAGLYQDLHPAVLRLIQMTADAARRGGKPVSICGELGSNPLATPILIGMGISEMSVVPTDVRSLATRVRLLRYDECRPLVDKILESSVSAEEVKRQILHFLHERELIDRFSQSALRPGFGARLIKR
ncbi:MAG: phosphoenolpyruvate--protein phosphotransferase [Bacteroidota bacterium]|nr:phosphoenolpyruvate--protein phosphotransferase [Bacteroidota bacterium]MDP4232590.1 phosphoenolpyruvate--protein phosphotransferase [Bacteroidota bacterium]MDP4242956.1 phosphoenolpyruvate--protein phosphotransferase [Bacteroidota bacterium]MDP4286469.1 phosphoenolpyruvate--protein phosphotransferase [Bacteroidota bacterium]